jgi:hypothetical protein
MTVGSASTNSTSFDEQIQALSCFDTTPPISTPPVSLGVYTTCQPYAAVINRGVGREGSRVASHFFNSGYWHLRLRQGPIKHEVSPLKTNKTPK